MNFTWTLSSFLLTATGVPVHSGYREQNQWYWVTVRKAISSTHESR